MGASGRGIDGSLADFAALVLQVRLQDIELDELMVTSLMIVYILADGGQTSAFSGLGAILFHFHVQ
jgi:CO/xanthine dehydrogenase Mo-binding subunit